MSFFIRGGSAIDAKMPLGRFILKYATGKSWCGDLDLFGSDTATYKADYIFTFEQKFTDGGYTLEGHTVELILQRNGNLQTSRINREAF